MNETAKHNLLVSIADNLSFIDFDDMTEAETKISRKLDDAGYLTTCDMRNCYIRSSNVGFVEVSL